MSPRHDVEGTKQIIIIPLKKAVSQLCSIESSESGH